MLTRLLIGAGLFAVGYLLGKEVGRMDPVREELQRARATAGEADKNPAAEPDGSGSASGAGPIGPEA